MTFGSDMISGSFERGVWVVGRSEGVFEWVCVDFIVRNLCQGGRGGLLADVGADNFFFMNFLPADRLARQLQNQLQYFGASSS